MILDVMQRIGIEDDDIRVLSGLQRADPLVDADDAGGIDRDGLPGGLFVHAGLHRKSRAQREIVQRRHGSVGDDADRQAGLVQDAGRRERLVLQFKFRLAAEGRPAQHGIMLLRQAIDDQMAFRHMVQRHLHVEFMRDADGRQHVVRAMRMDFQRNLALHDGNHRLQFRIVGALLRLILFRLSDFIHVAFRLHQQAAQQRRDGHARHRRTALLAMRAFRILAERAFHRDRILDDHVIDVIAVQLERGERSADHVGGARPDGGRRDARRQRVVELLVPRIDAVDGPHVRRQRFRAFVDIVALPTDGIFVQADMRMRVNQARRHDTSRRINDFRIFRNLQVFSDGRNLVAVDENLPVFDVAIRHRLDQTAANQFHCFFLLF